MFGFGKKKKNEPLTPVYTPQLGTAAAFKEKYGVSEVYLPIGKSGLNLIRVGGNAAPCNEITVINDVQKSVDNQFIIPLLKDMSMSYVVYDPNGTYQQKVLEHMKENEYDVQVVDLADKNHNSRINLFEITNMTKNAYWLSVVLAGTIKCTPQEIPVAHALFMAMMQYLLATKDKVDIVTLYNVFKKVKENNTEMWRELQMCPIARGEIAKVWKASPETRTSIYDKMIKSFFRTALTKTKEPNIFAATAHKKKTIYFIKEAPKRYNYLITTLLFNLKVANVIFNHGQTSLAIVDTADVKWYDKEILRQIEKEIGADKGFVNIHIRNSIGTPKNPYIRDNQLVLFMQSDDEVTKKYIVHCLKTREVLSEEEIKELEANLINDKDTKKKKKKKKNNAAIDISEILEASAVTMEELGSMMDTIVIDTSKSVKPFRCARLG